MKVYVSKYLFCLIILVSVVSVFLFDANWHTAEKAKCATLGGTYNLSGQCYKIVVVPLEVK